MVNADDDGSGERDDPATTTTMCSAPLLLLCLAGGYVALSPFPPPAQCFQPKNIRIRKPNIRPKKLGSYNSNFKPNIRIRICCFSFLVRIKKCPQCSFLTKNMVFSRKKHLTIKFLRAKKNKLSIFGCSLSVSETSFVFGIRNPKF